MHGLLKLIFSTLSECCWKTGCGGDRALLSSPILPQTERLRMRMQWPLLGPCTHRGVCVLWTLVWTVNEEKVHSSGKTLYTTSFFRTIHWTCRGRGTPMRSYLFAGNLFYSFCISPIYRNWNQFRLWKCNCERKQRDCVCVCWEKFSDTVTPDSLHCCDIRIGRQ